MTQTGSEMKNIITLIGDFVTSHPLGVLAFVFLIALAPQLFGALLLVVLFLLLVLFIVGFSALWKYREMMRGQNAGRNGWPGAQPREEYERKDGKVHVYTHNGQEKKIRDDVGEYVDFKEIKEDK